MTGTAFITRPCAVFILVITIAKPVAADSFQIPNVIRYDGYLAQTNGEPVTRRVVMDYSMFSTATGGDALWQESQTIDVVHGSFNILLGTQTPLSANVFKQASTLYLEITVNSQVLSPRKQLTPLPYAYICQNVVGTADVDSVFINGAKVIDSDAEWVGPVNTIASGVVSQISSSPVNLAAGSTIGHASLLTNSSVLDGTRLTPQSVSASQLAADISINTTGNISSTGIIRGSTLSNPTGGGTLTINGTTSSGADKISFTFGETGGGSEKAYLDKDGNFVVTGGIISQSGTITGSLEGGVVTSVSILDGTVQGVDIASGTIAGSNLANGTITGANIASDAVTLGTQTTGNYVATVSAGTNLSVSGSGGETSAVSVGTVSNPTFSASVTTPVLTNAAGGGTFTINGTNSGGSDKISFTFGVAGSGTEKASIDQDGNFLTNGNLVAANIVSDSTVSGVNTGDQTITLTGAVAGSGTGTFDTTIQPDSVTLGANTTGNYIATVSAGTNMSVSGSGTEAAALTISTVANPTFSTSVTTADLLLTGATPTLESTSGNTLVIKAYDSGGVDKISLVLDGEEKASLDDTGNLVVFGTISGSFSGTLASNTVNSDTIADSSITGVDVATLTITGTNIANDGIALGTKTTGNYVATVTAGTNMSVSGSGSETAAVSVRTIANPTFSTSVTTPDLLLTGATPTLESAAGSALVIKAYDSGGTDKISLVLDGSERASLSDTGALLVTGNIGFVVPAGAPVNCIGRTIVGVSAANTANAGGYLAANAVCNTAFSGSKICSYEQVMQSINCGVTMTGSATRWIESSFITSGQVDCTAWSATGSSSTAFTSNAGGTSGTFAAQACNTGVGWWCCK